MRRKPEQKDWSSLSARPIRIGSSLWIVAKKYIIEYVFSSDSIRSITEYYTAFESQRKCACCRYKNSIIVPNSDVKSSRIESFSVFDTKTRAFGDPIPFPQKMGKFLSCIAIGDHIHFFHGQNDRNGPYYIYSMIEQKMHAVTDCKCPPAPDQYWVPDEVIKMDDSYKSSSKMLISGFVRKRSGGQIPLVIVGLISEFYVFEFLKINTDCCYIGTTKGNDKEPIQWTVAPEFTLKSPLANFGHVQYGSYIVTFGGAFMDPRGAIWTDFIYILDLRKNDGWVLSSVTCPNMGQVYLAVLDDAQRVHLVTKSWGIRQYDYDPKDIIPHSMLE